MNALITLLAFAVLPAGNPNSDGTAPITSNDVRAAIEKGIDFLLKDQRGDGSWGGPQDSITTWSGDTWSNPETHRAWKVATTGLCCAALIEVGLSDDAREATDRALRYLIENADVKRPDVWDTMNNWAYIYGLQGLVTAHASSRYEGSPIRDEIANAAAIYLDNLARFQSLNGGWGYLEFSMPRTRRPQWATSFMTAAAVVAMQQARRESFDVDRKVIDRAVRVIKRCRLPNGAYTYRVRNVPNLDSEYIDQVKGSLSRIPVCQMALIVSGQEIPLEDRKFGLAHFFRDHKFLDIAMHRPIPHEAYYANSGYFYMFGHYYASLVIEGLPSADRSVYWPKLWHEIMKIQQQDGSMWDYDLHSYDKPYGVAYGLMALGRSLDE